jgi:uncharacterized repeat protein (TIGR03803 family)
MMLSSPLIWRYDVGVNRWETAFVLGGAHWRGNPSSGRKRLLLAVVTLALVSAAQAGPRYKILHLFGHGSDGSGPWGSLVFDAEGNAYGTTINGGTYNFGTVFELTPHSNGHWTETILHDFNCKGSEGCTPTADLAMDTAGNLYGTTTTTTFELSPGSGGWSLSVLQNEGGPTGLILDYAGNLYGPLGIGEYGQGAISKLVKDQNWTEDLLYSFCAKGTRKHDCLDGSDPYAGVTWGPKGSLYGTTVQYVVHGYGVVFQLSPQQHGTWQETVLHSFPAFEGDGQNPYEGVVLDKAGNVYGATSKGGSSTGCGVIFKLAPQANGKWKETILYDFPKAAQGCGANDLTLDAKGNLWGTAQGGTSGNGVVFELTPQQSGKWKYHVVHRFNWKDGSLPGSAVTFDKQGNLYGTTIVGGAPYYGGVAFEITP